MSPMPNAFFHAISQTPLTGSHGVVGYRTPENE